MESQADKDARFDKIAAEAELPGKFSGMTPNYAVYFNKLKQRKIEFGQSLGNILMPMNEFKQLIKINLEYENKVY